MPMWNCQFEMELPNGHVETINVPIAAPDADTAEADAETQVLANIAAGSIGVGAYKSLTCVECVPIGGAD